MATFYLRPSADISLEHSCSTGSSGYALINEATPDDDSKYIYYEDAGSSSSGTTYTKTSSFTCSGTIPSSYNITSVKFVIRARRNGDASSDSNISGTAGSSSLAETSLTSSYVNYEATATEADLSRSGNTVTATLSMVSKLKVYKDETGAIRITQAFIQVEAVDTSSKFYVKLNGAWKGVKGAYIKQNGSWVSITSTPSGWSANGKIRRYHCPWLLNKSLQRGEALIDYTGDAVTEYIPVTPDVELIVQGVGSNSTNTMWLDYTQDKTYHDYWGGSGTIITTIGSRNVYQRTLSASNMAGVYYIRVNTIMNTGFEYCKVWQNGVLLFDGSSYPPIT